MIELVMASRTTKVTQAEIERAIRAAKAAGLPILRIVARADGYAIEMENGIAPEMEHVRLRPKPVL
jgi:hypothetical protein